MEEKDVINRQINEEEINLVATILKLWRNRKFIIKTSIFFAVIGFFVAISTPNVYTASCTMVPQTGQKNSGGNLGGLAAMAGINLGSLSTGEVLSPSVYPLIMKNINFQKELIYSKFNFQKINQPITLIDYYTDKKYQNFSLTKIIKKYTFGLPGIIIELIKGKSTEIPTSKSTPIETLSINEKKAIEILSENLYMTVSSKDGYVTISANMNEPIVAAELAQKTLELLQKYITKFKIEKVTNNLKFVEKSYDESKKDFELKQLELARFRDSNKSFASALAKTQEEKLTSEYTLLLGIYTELAKQKEQAKIAVTETTPILTVIEPVMVPMEKSSPSRVTTFLLYVIAGFFAGIVVVFVVSYLEQNFFQNINKYWFIPIIF